MNVEFSNSSLEARTLLNDTAPLKLSRKACKTNSFFRWKQIAILKVENFIIENSHFSNLQIKDKISNYAFKGLSEKEAENISLADGQRLFDAVKSNLDYAKEFYAANKENLSPSEKIQLLNLIKHRSQLFETNKILASITLSKESKVEHLNALLDSLEDNSKAVKLLDGRASITIPLVTFSHYFSLEIQKDITGHYYLIVHDRGAEHTTAPVILMNGKEYGKISPRIPIEKDKLKKPEFLRLIANSNFTFRTSVQLIKEFEKILGTCLSDFYSETEKKLFNYIHSAFHTEKSHLIRYEELNAPAQEEFHKLKNEDQSWGSFQTRGTCTESNQTAQEKQIVSLRLYKAVKAFAIYDLIQKNKTL